MEFKTSAFELFDRDWAPVTAGNKDSFNTMTISWGRLGTLWGKPVATVYVKPVRYTHDFMESSEFFTVSFYAESYRKALGPLDSMSRRACNNACIPSKRLNCRFVNDLGHSRKKGFL